MTVSRRHVRSGRAQAVYVNAGNANTCTGQRGERDAMAICREVAKQSGIDVEDNKEIIAMIAYLQRLGTDLYKDK